MSRFLRTAGSDDSSLESESADDDESDSDGDAAQPQKKVSRSRRDQEDESEDEDDVKRIAIDNALKINHWVAISNEFDKLVRLAQRQTNVAERIPDSISDSLNNAMAKEKEAKKKMNLSNSRAFNGTKQKMKKINKEYEADIKHFQEDPEGFEHEYAAAVAEPAVDVEEEGDEGGDFTSVGKGGKALGFTPDSVFKNLQTVQESCGKKNTDRVVQNNILERLLEVANTSYQRIRVLLALISSRFNYNSSVSTHMPISLWLASQREVDQLVAIVMGDPSYSGQEITEDYDEFVECSLADEKDGVVRIRGSIISFVDRLDDEFTKSLQNIDPHGTEYVDRLKDDKGLYESICQAQAFYEKTNQLDPLARVIMRHLEHIYSKPDAVIQALEQTATQSKLVPSTTPATQGSSSSLIHSLSVSLYKSDNSFLCTRAMLCHIYHHALANEFYVARDMLLMSHLQESVHAADVATQILYNRTVVQLGICAFRKGLIREAQSTLQDIFTAQQVKELLAQGVHQQRYQTLTPEQEKADRQRQLPFHMHINTELLEAAFLVSGMLVEIPLLASIDNKELKRKAISKPFRRLLDFADRQVFTGPPETTRDHIMQASKALQDGEWEKCRDLIQSIKIWSLMPGGAQSVKDMLARRIQEEGLRTYLFTYALYYSTLSLSLLSRTFSLSAGTVTSTVSKMIWNEELAASLDQSSGVVVFHRVEVMHVQQLAQSLADKLGTMMEQNEKGLDLKLGGGSAWADRTDGTKQEKRTSDQAGERRRTGEQWGGTASRGGTRGGRGARFAQGLGNQMGQAKRHKGQERE
ncbi:eukaryotic translation initiation factor 3 subunit 8 N-terminus-domain-containing protein, partial [Gautieria morchelliformis]